MKYSSLKYSEFILAFQLQFGGTCEAESEHFRWEKEKRHFKSGFQDKKTFYILVIFLIFDF